MYREYELLGAGKGAAYTAAMKKKSAAIAAAKAASANLTATAGQAVTALKDAGYTSAQIAEMRTDRTGIIKAAETNTTWKPGTVSQFGKNPMIIYLAIAAGAAGLFYISKKRKTSSKKRG
jgi:hypothetical protein